MPDIEFDASTALTCRVDAKARICVRQSYYSVPARLAGRRVQVRLGTDRVTAHDDGKIIAEHTRSLHKGTEDLVLDHYLEVLTRKPGALAGATALAAARANGSFTPVHQKFWDAARRALGDTNGTRALIEALLLNRVQPRDAVDHAMTEAIRTGRYQADLLAVAARAHQAGQRCPAPPVPLPANAAHAATVTRPAPGLAGYDQLLPTLTGAPS